MEGRDKAAVIYYALKFCWGLGPVATHEVAAGPGLCDSSMAAYLKGHLYHWGWGQWEKDTGLPLWFPNCLCSAPLFFLPYCLLTSGPTPDAAL